MSEKSLCPSWLQHTLLVRCFAHCMFQHIEHPVNLQTAAIIDWLSLMLAKDNLESDLWSETFFSMKQCTIQVLGVVLGWPASAGVVCANTLQHEYTTRKHYPAACIACNGSCVVNSTSQIAWVVILGAASSKKGGAWIAMHQGTWIKPCLACSIFISKYVFLNWHLVSQTVLNTTCLWWFNEKKGC